MRLAPALARVLTGFSLFALATLIDAAEEPSTYQPVPGVSGRLTSVGSDTLASMVMHWGRSFTRFYPAVQVQVQGAGSSTAPPALTEATANLAAMSRAMKDSELQAFERRYGYPPTAIPVALDALAILVHKDNPLPRLDITQVDALFSATRRCGAPTAIEEWSALGLTGLWKERPIQLYGRNSVSGTYGYFKRAALCKGDFRARVNEQPGSASVVQAVSTSLNGIGYSSFGYQTASVRAVPLARQPGGPAIAATEANAVNGNYPLARYLYVYVNKPPLAPLEPLEREFLRLILSREGQAGVRKEGYIPLPPDLIADVRQEHGL